jgi:hypothetical protein
MKRCESIVVIVLAFFFWVHAGATATQEYNLATSQTSDGRAIYSDRSFWSFAVPLLTLIRRVSAALLRTSSFSRQENRDCCGGF